MNAIILSIGDELVLGQTVDTNSAWISQQVASVGITVRAHLTVADDQPAIEQAILESVGRCDALICTGGIGPTEDDLTRQALASVMGVELELNEVWLRELEAFFRKMGRPMSPLNRIQAMIPKGAKAIHNSAGTAAGIDATYVHGDQKTICRIFVMPGVPTEMKLMFQRDILPHIRNAADGSVIISRTLHTFGSGESRIAELLGDLMRRDRNPSVGTTVTGGIVSLRLNCRCGTADEATQKLAETEQACRACLGDLIYGNDDQTLASVVADLLKQHRRTVTTAESCTGGLLAKLLTDLPGSSAYFHQGVISYANEAKVALLNVPPRLLEQHGAVSEPVVRAMAQNARTAAGADYALAISGIAGPTGGTPQKPVGTVCIALAAAGEKASGNRNGNGATSPIPSPAGVGETVTRTFVFPGDREMIRDRAAKMALAMLRLRLLGSPLIF